MTDDEQTPETATETDPDTATDAPGASDAAREQVAADYTDGGEALRRASESIREAEEAEGAVAASDDIPILDDEKAGRFSEDQGGRVVPASS